MLRVLAFFWVFVSKFTVCVYGAIIRFIFRFQIDGDCKGNEIGPTRFNGFMEKQRIEHDENEKRERENGLVATSSKYEFLYTPDISGFVEEPKTESFTLHEFFMGSSDPTESAQIHPPKSELGTADGCEEKLWNPVDSFVSGKSGEKQERDANIFEGKTEYSVEEDAGGSIEDKAEHSLESFIEKQEMEANMNVEEKEEDSIEISIIEKRLEKQEPRKEAADGTEEDAPLQSSEKQEQDEKEGSDALEVKIGDPLQTSSIEMNSDDQESLCLHELNENVETDSSRMIDYTLEVGDTENVENTDEIHLCSEQKSELENSCVGQEHSSNESVVCSEKLGESISNSDEEDDDMEYEELKMQLRMARTGGLPTISEESEFSKMVEELHPLKIDEKLDRKDHIVEIHKVYKRYSDKMRKLDILNSQTKHAISLLQLSDLVQLNATGKSSAAPVKSVLQKNMWPFKQRKREIDRAVKLIRDLEIVYVGQMCLSWEILRWQHGKVQQLLPYDPQGSFRYNHVTGEFQLFQVLVQRYLENEPFQGRPRVEDYVKNRCLLPNFLQVPVIKDDGAENGKRVGQVELDEHAISSALLMEIMEESMQVFWEFLRADKDETNLSLKAAPQQRQVAPQGPLDLGLLVNVRTNLQKKERRLKEIIRSTNCIVKKLQKNQRTALDHAVFIAQVELKLVSRVLNASKLTTDHLVWCHEKLEKINFSGRKLEIKPSMLLFPC